MGFTWKYVTKYELNADNEHAHSSVDGEVLFPVHNISLTKTEIYGNIQPKEASET